MNPIHADSSLTNTITNLQDFHDACFLGDLEEIKKNLASGVNINAEVDDWNPLSIACRHGTVELVQFLIEAGALVNVKDSQGWTPLLFACREGSVEKVRLLLEKGAEVAVALPNEWTPLHLASKCGKPELVELLLEHGADISARTDSGKTPSHVATKETRKVLFFHEIAQFKENWLAFIPSKNATYILNKNSLNYYTKESFLCLRTKALIVLATTPIFTVGIMFTHLVKIITDVVKILFTNIKRSFCEVPKAIADRIWRCIRSPFYALKMSFASVYGVYSVHEGRERMNQVAKDWEETALLNFTGLRKVANLKESPMKGLPRRLFLQKI